MFDINQIKLFLFDMDGTIYLGDQLFEPTIPLLNAIKEQGKRYLFMTNNSSKSVEAYVEKLKKLGITSCKEDFMTSSQATAYFLNKKMRRAFKQNRAKIAEINAISLLRLISLPLESTAPALSTSVSKIIPKSA